MSLPSYAVDFRGHPACPCQPRWFTALEAEAHRQGILVGPLPISQLIGGDPRSGGTHTDGGAGDLYPLAAITDVPAFLRLCRDMGADATWHRPYDWDHEDGVEHIHIVLRGCPHNGPARYQYDSPAYGVDHGHNGLASGALDDGPRPLSGRTWRHGIEWAQQQEDDMTPDQDRKLDQIAEDAQAARLAGEKAIRLAEGIRRRALAQTTRLRARLDRVIEAGKATKVDLEELRDQVADIETAVAADED